MKELDNVHFAYNELLFQSNVSEWDIDKELETDDTYKTQFLTAKMSIITIITSTSKVAMRAVTKNVARMSKFPKLELLKFSGNIKD